MVTMTLYTRQQKRHRCKEQTFGLHGRRRGWDDFERIIYIETCILPYVKYIASPGSIHETGCSGPVHWDDLRDGMGRKVGEEFRMGDTCIPMTDSCEFMAKTTTIL